MASLNPLATAAVMKRDAYIPLERLGPKTHVTFDSQSGMPIGMNREDEVVLPPGSATRGSPDPEKSNPDVYDVRMASPYYNTPDGTIDVEERVRSLPTPGDQQEWDYGNDAVDHFKRRSIQGKNYKPRQPWKRQKTQPLWDRLDDEVYYKKNKSKINRRVLKRYKFIKNDRRFVERKEDRREDPDKYERRRMAEDTNTAAYKPTPLSSRRHRQRGQAKIKRHRNYIRNRAKTRVRQKRWYHKNKSKPGFKRRVNVRKKNPNRYKLRYASADVSFFIGPQMSHGTITAMSPGSVRFDVDGEQYDMKSNVFALCALFDDDCSADAFYDVAEEIDPTIYDPIEEEDLQEVASLYGYNIEDSDECPEEVLCGIVEDSVDVVLAGDIHMYDQESKTPWERPETGPQTSPSGPGVYSDQMSEGYPSNGVDDDRGLSSQYPASSAKVIPDHMKYAATIAELVKGAPNPVKAKVADVVVDAYTKSGLTWTFKVGGEYTVKAQEKRGKIRVSCDCKFFRYQGPEHWASREGYLLGKPAGTAAYPSQTDPKGANKICKHVLACLQVLDGKVQSRS